MIKQIFKEHWEYRQQIWKLARADLDKTYRGAVLGWLWVFVKPAVTIFVFWFAIELGLRASNLFTEYSFFLWLIAGLIPWFYMNDMLIQGTDSIRKYRYLVTKMKFPVSTIPTFVSISKLAVNLVFVVALILIFCFAGYPPTIYYLQILFYVPLMFLFFTTWALFAALMAALSKDFLNLVKAFVTAVFWLSGIIYDVTNTGLVWLQRVMMWNPVTFFVDGMRDAMVRQVWFWEKPLTLLCFFIVFFVMILLALWAFRRLPREIADVL